jgi:RNA polymerase sigma-70 factor (ECF subfamily)
MEKVVTVAMRRSEPPGEHAFPEGEAAPESTIDAREFAQLFAAEAPRVWRVLRRLGVRDADLEDVCQEVFLVVYRRWDEFRGESKRSTWICGIAANKALGHRRLKHVRDATALTAAHEPSCAPSQQRGLEQQDARQALELALQKLSADQREVFVLFELEQLPMREIADALTLPLATAYTRLYAGRATFAAELRRLASLGRLP